MQTPARRKLFILMPVIIFVAFSVWWLYLKSLNIELTRDSRQLWGATYQILALYGAFIGIWISHKWGGYKSLLGRAVLAFSVGLLFQSFGQTSSSYYVFIKNIESPPYPGMGDIGFFGSLLSYIYGGLLLCRLVGAKIYLKKIQNKVWIILIPIVLLIASYLFFLQGYEFDWTNKLKIFLDFGYPLGDAIYVSLAILALIMSRNILGGIMKKPILLLIFALLFQYFSDFFFLYEANAGIWYVGNINDYLYCTSYFIMTISLILIGRAFYKIQNS